MTDPDSADTDRHPGEDGEPEGGQPQERPEDRPNVGSTTPDDHPASDRAEGRDREGVVPAAGIEPATP